MESFFTSLSPQFSVLAMPEWIDMAAVVVGAAFGGLTATERKLDLFGAAGLGMLCGLGGGLIRDMIMQRGTVFMLDSPWAIPVAAVAGMVAFFFSGLFRRIDRITAVVDILSVGIYTATGTDKAVVAGLTFVACLLMGVLTGVGGGMLRDIFLGDVPQIFRPGNLYACCALLSGAVYYGLVYMGLVKGVAVVACVAVCCLLRWASLRYNIQTPSQVDLTPRVIDYTRRLKERQPGDVSYHIPYRASRYGHGVRVSQEPTRPLTVAEQARHQRVEEQERAQLKDELKAEIKEELAAEERLADEGQATGSAEAIFGTPETMERLRCEEGGDGTRDGGTPGGEGRGDRGRCEGGGRP